MAITRTKKEGILSKLTDIKKDASTIVFVGFKGLPVGDSTAMRRQLKSEGVGYFVAKKTLISRALDGAYKGEIPPLQGEVAVAYSEDAIVSAQQVREFEKKFKDSIAILGGVFEGVYKTKEEMTEIASIPPLQVLRGMFLNVINSPIQGLAVALGQIAERKS